MIRRVALIAVAGLAMGLGGAEAQDRTLVPAYGIAKLAAGFENHSVPMLAGGNQNAASTIGGNCVGFVAEAPDLRLLYTAGGEPLVFSVTSETDTTLVISDPDGNWICNDDSGGSLNPRIALMAPASGEYNIWVGTYSEGAFGDATLEIAETAVTLDWNLAPNYGTFDLGAGFEPDPFTVNLDAGGDVDASISLDNCRGFVTAAPDVRLNYTAGAFPLIFSVDADADTTLIVNDPSGAWICDDDSGPSLNPLIALDNPQSGQYDIWIGTYSPGPATPATLFVSEIAGQLGGELNWDLDPLFGAIDLAAGFSPDPFSIELAAGGDVDASTVGDNCRGYVTSAPGFRVQYQAGDFPLVFSVESDADTTLVIADPDGNWFCNDDANGTLDPEIVIDAPVNGQYDIWVGTFGEGVSPPATLHITERRGEAGDGVIDWALTPTFGEVDLAAGFTPDPFTVEVTAGGNLAASGAAAGCFGNVTAAPSFRLYYDAGDLPLYIWVDANADTTLLISDPDGNWICDDDGGAVFLSPALGWDDPAPGQYDIWVGTYTGDRSPAVISISETIDGRVDTAVPTPPSPPPVIDVPPGPASVPPPDPPPSAPPASGPVFIE